MESVRQMQMLVHAQAYIGKAISRTFRALLGLLDGLHSQIYSPQLQLIFQKQLHPWSQPGQTERLAPCILSKRYYY